MFMFVSEASQWTNETNPGDRFTWLKHQGNFSSDDSQRWCLMMDDQGVQPNTYTEWASIPLPFHFASLAEKSLSLAGLLFWIRAQPKHKSLLAHTNLSLGSLREWNFSNLPQLPTSPTSGPCLIKQEKEKKTRWSYPTSLDNDRGKTDGIVLVWMCQKQGANRADGYMYLNSPSMSLFFVLLTSLLVSTAIYTDRYLKCIVSEWMASYSINQHNTSSSDVETLRYFAINKTLGLWPVWIP